MNTLITQLIRNCRGYVYESAGIISGFFDDPSDARQCASRIEAQIHVHVDLCGCELMVMR